MIHPVRIKSLQRRSDGRFDLELLIDSQPLTIYALAIDWASVDRWQGGIKVRLDLLAHTSDQGVLKRSGA